MVEELTSLLCLHVCMFVYMYICMLACVHKTGLITSLSEV